MQSVAVRHLAHGCRNRVSRGPAASHDVGYAEANGRMKKFLVILCALSRGLPPPASAQSVSPLAIQGTGGNVTGHGGDYRERVQPVVQLRASVRFLRRAHVAGVVGVEWDSHPVFQALKLICVVRADGSCIPQYPWLSGVNASLGVIAAPHARIELGAGIGPGSYADGRTRVGAIAAHLEGAAFPFQHVGLMIGVRRVVLPNYYGGSLSLSSTVYGLRLR